MIRRKNEQQNLMNKYQMDKLLLKMFYQITQLLGLENQEMLT